MNIKFWRKFKKVDVVKELTTLKEEVGSDVFEKLVSEEPELVLKKIGVDSEFVMNELKNDFECEEAIKKEVENISESIKGEQWASKYKKIVYRYYLRRKLGLKTEDNLEEDVTEQEEANGTAYEIMGLPHKSKDEK